ncbi:MAG: hypothetical protein M3Q08_09810 [Pseudomonadota bacterium]|nr:hypothetical protein [Pseudomonadota bacterium]
MDVPGMTYGATTCPQCLLKGDFWHLGPLVICEACGPVMPTALEGYEAIVSRMRQLKDMVAALQAELAEVEQLVTRELWLAVIRPHTTSCAQKRAAGNCTQLEILKTNQALTHE